MPAVKGKVSPTSHRYRPASEYDDATLAQKREYWRNKKREQRARLSERRGRPNQDSGGGTLPRLHVPVDSVQIKPGSQFRNPAGDNQEEERLQTKQIKVSPQLQPVSCSILAKAPTSNGTQLDTSSSVPPITRTTSRSTTSVPVSQSKAQAAPPVRSRLIATDVTTTLSSLHGHVSVKIEAGTPNAAPERGIKSGPDVTPRAGGVGGPPASLESEEERAAKRREHWRIKKREQRAKLAAQVAKARERTASVEVALQRPAARSGLLPAPFVRGEASKLIPIRVKVTIPCVNKTAGGARDLPTHHGTVQHPRGDKMMQTAAMLDASVRTPAESQRKASSYLHHCNIPRGIARCKTPWQRFMDTQRSFRCKSPSMASVFGPRSLPRIQPGDTPEQIIAKRREYWRVKKREQRAKLSMETRARLKEKDSLMRRVKRYQQILEEMRRARALTQSTGSGLTHAAEAIGGFIKEDGTLTVNVPHCPKHVNTTGDGEKLQVIPKNSHPSMQHRINLRRRGVPLVRTTQLPQSVRKAPRLLSIRPHPHPASTGPAVGSGGGGVRKMSVSPLMALTLDPGLTQEERMAKKREYWRVKKREQRAARAGAALQRRKAHKQAVAKETDSTGSTQALPKNVEAFPPHGDGIKRESEPAADLNSPAELIICPDIKPPTSPPPLEPDPALSADSQATTLLAVASMKKLLEESLSTVTEIRSQQTHIKTEATEDAPEPDVKPSLPPIFLQRDDASPIAADLTLQIKSWHPDTEVPSDLQLNTPSKPLPTCSEVVHSSPTPPTFRENVSMETPEGPTSPRRTQRLCARKVGHPNCCPPEPPRLHHIPSNTPAHQQERQQNNNRPSGQRSCSLGPEQGGLSSLQRKREYWKMMKRQQRARLKARQGERQGEGDSLLVHRDIQTPGRLTGPTKPSLPGVLVVSPTCSDQSADLVHLTPTSREDHGVEPPPNVPKSTQCSLEWTPQSSEVDPAPSLSTLKPPDNPLSSINLQPIESPGQSPTSILSPIRIPCVQLPTPTSMGPSSTKLAPMSPLVPPKRIPGESEEDFLRRKREYWRIKKKEQRARKAVGDKGSTPRRPCSSWRSILPAQDPQTQRPPKDSSQWMTSSQESEHLMSLPADSDPGPFPYSDYPAQGEDEPELLFAEYEEGEDEDSPVSDAVWRKRYLMDHDPLNQLLVCMVCGELQYSHSLEGVRAHIDEAHPHTLALDPGEKQRILEAWDEQVSRRERFFTSQLQQHGGTLTEANRN